MIWGYSYFWKHPHIVFQVVRSDQSLWTSNSSDSKVWFEGHPLHQFSGSLFVQSMYLKNKKRWWETCQTNAFIIYLWSNLESSQTAQCILNMWAHGRYMTPNEWFFTMFLSFRATIWSVPKCWCLYQDLDDSALLNAHIHGYIYIHIQI